jgi:hypothetical protein
MLVYDLTKFTIKQAITHKYRLLEVHNNLLKCHITNKALADSNIGESGTDRKYM